MRRQQAIYGLMAFVAALAPWARKRNLEAERIRRHSRGYGVLR